MDYSILEKNKQHLRKQLAVQYITVFLFHSLGIGEN